MRQVTKEEFWAFIMGANVDIVSSVEGNYPYTSIFKTRYGKNEVGRIVDRHETAGRTWPVTRDYFLDVQG